MASQIQQPLDIFSGWYFRGKSETPGESVGGLAREGANKNPFQFGRGVFVFW